MNQSLGLFLSFFLVCVFTIANADENEISNSLLESYHYKNQKLLGSYYSIGTFRALENARLLGARYKKFKPLVILLRKKNKIFYRVIIGPVNVENKELLKSSLISFGVNDLWLIKINGPTKIIYKKKNYYETKQLKVKPRLKENQNATKSVRNRDAATKKNNFFEYTSGKIFSDCKVCPKQVVVPAGDFIMGEENGGLSNDAIAISVSIPRAFSISKFEITFNLWDACLAEGGCSNYKPLDEGWGRGQRPVINVNRKDIIGYLNWLRKKTGKLYRLPSEAEWEYASRSGTTTPYWWGRKPGINRAVCQDCGSIYDGEKTAKVGSFRMNKFGLFDTSGNVWEWVEDCYNKDAYKIHKSYPQPFYQIKNSIKNLRCSRVLRGGSWSVVSMGIKPSFRFMSLPKIRSKSYGFRVVREMQ
jgi:formylglycine-generating enzyme required for sulfatase activity